MVTPRTAITIIAGFTAAASLAFGAIFAASQAQAGPPYVSVCPENTNPPNPNDPAIIVEVPSEGAEVSSPMRVSGKARVFEANVIIELLDADGNELVRTFTTALAGAPELAPFSTDITFNVSKTQPGCLRVLEGSAMDGSDTNVVQVEVTLKAPATSVPTSATPKPPSTGTGDAGNSGADVNALIAVTAAALALTGVAGALLRKRNR